MFDDDFDERVLRPRGPFWTRPTDIASLGMQRTRRVMPRQYRGGQSWLRSVVSPSIKDLVANRRIPYILGLAKGRRY